MEETNILEFIGFEQQNTLISIANLKSELGFLIELDGIYQEVKNSFDPNIDNIVHFMTGVMFLKTRNELYIGMSQLLRSHLSKAFLSLRIAIDSAFNAYYFTENPEHTKDFTEENSPLQKKIFWRIKDHVSKNPKKFPLAKNLVKIHDFASNFAAHSSIQSMVYKYQHIINEEQKKEEVKLNFFDGLDVPDFLSYYFKLLKGYFMIFQLFYNCFYKKELRIENPYRDRRIATFETKLNSKMRQYPLRKEK